MDDKTFEIRDEEINVNEIMEKIRENLRKKVDDDSYPTDPDLLSNTPVQEVPLMDSSNDTIQQDLTFINTNWDIHNNSYFIKSNRPYLSSFIVKGRQLVHREVQRYVDPMISQQAEFNKSMVHINSMQK
jgi:hypothetical protein